MTHTNGFDLELQDLLSAVTDALLASKDVEAVIEQYHAPRAQVEGFLWLIDRLHATLVGVQPSRRFTKRLKGDLLRTPQPNVVARVRRLPARVQITAGIALLAGFVLLARRRTTMGAQHDAQEVPALQ